MKSRSDLPPGLNFVEDDKLKDTAGLSKSTKRNKKKREKKKQAAAAVDGMRAITDSMNAASLSPSSRPDKSKQSNSGQSHSCEQQTSQSSANAAALPQEVDPSKRLKSLKKKLRQIEGLEAKINSGELKNPEKEQLEKVARKQELLDEIEDLELELVDI